MSIATDAVHARCYFRVPLPNGDCQMKKKVRKLNWNTLQIPRSYPWESFPSADHRFNNKQARKVGYILICTWLNECRYRTQIHREKSQSYIIRNINHMPT